VLKLKLDFKGFVCNDRLRLGRRGVIWMAISVKERIIQAVERLSEEEQKRLLEIIEQTKRQPESLEFFLDFIKSEADPKVTLAQVRHELSSIKGNLSDLVIAEREE